MIRQRASAVVVAAALALGCGSAPDPASQDKSPHEIAVAASSASTQELGVVQWKLTKNTPQEVFAITGYDAEDKVRSEIRHWIKRDASGTVVEGGSASMVQGPAYFHYTNPESDLLVDRNDFKKSAHAARALELATADLQTFANSPAPASDSANAGLVGTTSVHPLDPPPGSGGSLTPGPKSPIVDPPCSHTDPIIVEGMPAGNPTLGTSCNQLIAEQFAAPSLYPARCGSFCPPGGMAQVLKSGQTEECINYIRDIGRVMGALHDDPSCDKCYPQGKRPPPYLPPGCL
jgi:hypothetical protein